MDGQIQREKDRLRKIVRERTRDLPNDYIKSSDRDIRARLLALEQWERARTVFIYVSMNREPDTRIAIQKALDDGKIVTVPRCLDDGEMEARIIISLDDLRRGRFGILEPDDHWTVLHPRYIDLIVTPCVAADRQGYRLGHGGGYYDRYLAKIDCPAVCLCRERLLQTGLPHGALDRPVDMVLTEEKCIRTH